jgi:hypothetical protein
VIRSCAIAVAPICKRLDLVKLNENTEDLTISGERPFNLSSHGIINLACEVEASPSNVTFHWTFNSTKELSDVPHSQYMNDDTISKLSHLLRTDADYGTFGCWANNSIGYSKQPCLYFIPPPGRIFFSRPPSPTNSPVDPSP